MFQALQSWKSVLVVAVHQSGNASRPQSASRPARNNAK